MTPTTAEYFDILRRIAERGRLKALREGQSQYCDLFQHLLDELVRLKMEVSKQ